MSKTDAENGKANMPKLLVEQDAAADADDAVHVEDSGGAGNAEDAAEQDRSARRRARKKARSKGRSAREDLPDAAGFIRSLGVTVWAYAEDHPFTVGYSFVGFVLAVLVLTIGLWSTIVIAVFVLFGALLGQIRDGDNGIVNFFSRLFDRHS